MIRVLVVEDSKTVQQTLVAGLGADPEISVVGVAESGEAALEAVSRLRPDLVTMDVYLPGMNGLEATRAIMSTCPLPIVIVTGRLDPGDSGEVFRAIEAGALMVLSKPEPVGTPGYAPSMARLVQHVKLMSEIKVVRRSPAADRQSPSQPLPLPQPPQVKVVALGASTGGPPVIQRILSGVPDGFDVPLLIVQHMSDGFAGDFVRWLNQSSRLPVMLAEQGMPLRPGEAYLAPDGCHLEVGPGGNFLQLSPAPPENGVRPSVAVLFRSVALRYGAEAAGILLSGMGSDGAPELRKLRELGAVTVAQNKESCVVFGMPGRAVELGAAGLVLAPEEIIELLAVFGRTRGKAAGGKDR